MDNKIAIFQGKTVRKTMHNNEWRFSVTDIVQILTDSSEVKQYIKRLRERDNELSTNWGTICTPLQLITPDRKVRKASANTAS